MTPGRFLEVAASTAAPKHGKCQQGGIDPGRNGALMLVCAKWVRRLAHLRLNCCVSMMTWLYYDIPLPLADRLWHGQYKGQKQKWLALRFTGKDADININTA
jgi:putative (di)nucleoside polyphosphate hydrolase